MKIFADCSLERHEVDELQFRCHPLEVSHARAMYAFWILHQGIGEERSSAAIHFAEQYFGILVAELGAAQQTCPVFKINLVK